jgi:hypothetical protein
VYIRISEENFILRKLKYSLATLEYLQFHNTTNLQKVELPNGLEPERRWHPLHLKLSVDGITLMLEPERRRHPQYRGRVPFLFSKKKLSTERIHPSSA